MSRSAGWVAALRRVWRENLRRRSEVSWGGFAVEMAVVLALNAAAAAVLLATGGSDTMASLTAAGAGTITGYTVLRIVMRMRSRRPDIERAAAPLDVDPRRHAAEPGTAHDPDGAGR